MAKVKSIKKYSEKTEKRKDDREKSKSESLFTVNSISYVILFAIFLFSFYIRGIIPIESVFSRGVVAFAMDDSVFHMRLVENTLYNFPHRIFFDIFTKYPYGNQLHWGPLFTQMIAFFALIAGFITNNWNPNIAGMPAQSVIDTVGAFYPAILGSLIVFPVYFIGKELFDTKAGLLGAFLLSILPGQFLSRSILGFTDNNIAEPFYVTIMMMFFIMTIKRAENISFDHWLNKDWSVLKKPLIYSLLTGISFGAYLLNWSHGVFFAVVFGIFIVIQNVIDHIRGKSTEYLGIISIIIYVVAMIMVIPYVKISNGFSAPYYSLLHVVVTGGFALFFALLSVVSMKMNRRKYNTIHYLLFVFGTILISLIIIHILSPDLYNISIGSSKYIFKGSEGGGLTIAEDSPISNESLVGNFGYNYYFSYIAILALCYYIIRKSKAEYTLLAVWSIFVLAILLAHNRFAYYYAVNVAILAGFLGSRILDFSGWKSFDSNDIIECLKKIRIQHIISLFIVVAFIGFLPSGASPFESTCGGWPWSCESTKWGSVGSGQYEWYNALTWMRSNTPDPGLDYYAIYEKPENGTFQYPESAYGVMSWWDYGHIITYWGHRIPNANPFQAGIGGGADHAPGAATFLIAPTEEVANKVLDDLGINGNPGARYVVSNAYMAYSIQPVFAEWDNTNEGYFEPVQTSKGTQYWPSMKYYNTMESKLHIFDTNGLQTYRLVHESTPNPYTSGGNEEKVYKSIYNTLNRASPIPAEDSGYAKIFEHVKGVKITGSAPPNSIVTLTNTIKTNIGRTIQYKQVTTSNGTYELIVPYSTLGSISGQTQFDTKPTGAYSVTAGNISKQVEISEKDVLEGGSVTLDLV